MSIGFPLLIIFALLSFSPYKNYLPGPAPGEWMSLLCLLPAIHGLLKNKRQDQLIQGVMAVALASMLMLSALFQKTDLDSLDAFKLPFQWFLFAGLLLFTHHFLNLGGLRALDRIRNALLFAAFLTAGLSLVQFALGPTLSFSLMPWGPDWTPYYTRLGFRTYSFFDNPLLTGCFLTVVLPLSFDRLLAARRRMVHWLVFVFIGLGILVSGSRSCQLLTPILLILMAWPRFQFMGRFACVAVCIAGFSLVLVSPLGDRFLDLFSFHGDANLNNRVVAVDAGLAMVSDAPLLGLGPGLFSEAYAQHYRPIQSQIDESAYTLDNLLFQLACEAGVPFAFLCFLFFLMTWNRAWHHRRHIGRGPFFSLLAFALLSLGVALYATPLMWLFILLSAVSVYRCEAVTQS